LETTRKSVAEKRVVEKRRRFKEGDFDPWTDSGGAEPLSLLEAKDKFLQAKEENMLTDRTLDTYRQQLEAWIDDCPVRIMLRDVQPDHIQRYVYDASIAQSTRHKRYRHVKVFLRWTVKAGHIDDKYNPLSDVDEPEKDKSVPVYLTPEQLDRLLKYIDWHAENKEDAVGRSPDLQWLRDAVQIAVATGLRRGELLALRWKDVDLEKGQIHVRNREDFRTKSGAERVVPVRGPALSVLRRRYEERDEFAGPVITDREEKPVKPDRLTKRFKDMVRGAKLKERERLKFHSLRHSCGAWLASRGVSSRIIQEILGHASSQTTEIYSHLSSSAVEGAMEETFGK
jgi:integrase